jgi:ubiquitin C-terminal hydrolase
MKPPVIPNTSDFITDSSNMMLTNFRPIISSPLANFRNSCYFGSSLQLIYAMGDIRNNILIDNFIEVDDSEPNAMEIRQAMKDIGGLIKKMNLASGPIMNFPEYLSVKKAIMGDARPTEEDASEFIFKFIQYLLTSLKNLTTIKGTTVYYHPITGVMLHSVNNGKTIFEISSTFIKPNPSASILELFNKQYSQLTFLEGVDSIPHGSNYLFSYQFTRITDMPRYLILHLDMIDNGNKIINNCKINTTLSVDKMGIKMDYLLLAIVVHWGRTIESGHYSSLVFRNRKQSNLEYIYYNDAFSSIETISITSKFIPENLYKKSGTQSMETPYVLLYGDITKIN